MDIYHPMEVLPNIEYFRLKNPQNTFYQKSSIYELYNRLKRKNVGIPFWKKIIRFFVYLLVFLMAFIHHFYIDGQLSLLH